jgi:hypothetical protein
MYVEGIINYYVYAAVKKWLFGKNFGTAIVQVKKICSEDNLKKKSCL